MILRELLKQALSNPDNIKINDRAILHWAKMTPSRFVFRTAPIENPAEFIKIGEEILILWNKGEKENPLFTLAKKNIGHAVDIAKATIQKNEDEKNGLSFDEILERDFENIDYSNALELDWTQSSKPRLKTVI